MTSIACQTVLTAEGWKAAQRVDIGADGRIAGIAAQRPGDAAADIEADLLIPAPANLHSHAFQRAMAGLTEARGPEGADSFWSWRRLMYRFVDALTPEDVEAIAAWTQVESLEAGFAAVVEFHYLHHQADGSAYDRPAEMGERIAAAADETGCGLTLLPALYHQGGCDGRPLGPGQRRFGCAVDAYAALVEASGAAIARLPADARLGVAPHALRAVSEDGLAAAIALGADRPIHIHIAEQTAEVDEVSAFYGARPVERLLDAAPVDGRWCLIHATQTTPAEIEAIARAGAVVGLCPITEANLGDGVFDGVRLLCAGGRFGAGSDSNIRIDLAGELRQLEYTQRLRDRSRAALASSGRSTGRRLLEDAAVGGAAAAARGGGRIEPGATADLLALDLGAVDLIGKTEDAALDAWIFAGAEPAVRDVWSAGRHVVRSGRHIARERVRARYAAVLTRLAALL